MESNSIMVVYSENDKTEIKEENSYQDGVTHKPQVPQNYIKCEVSIKQETVGLTEPELRSYLGTDVIKDEIEIKEEPTWSVATLTEEKELKEVKEEASERIPPLESHRFSTEADDNSIEFSDVEKDESSPKTVFANKATQGNSVTQNSCTLNCSQKCGGDNFESEQNIGDESLKVYQCEICEKCYRYKGSLQRHISVHLDPTPQKCEHCEKYFTHDCDLKRHKLLHSGTKRFKCDKCGKFFTQRFDLKKHKQIHSGTKPFKCDQCGKCFTKRFDLKRHKLLHIDTTPYKCHKCTKCFTQKSDLKRHILRHSGMPYKCTKCQKPFTQSHSCIPLYKCDICKKCFTDKSKLERHTLKHSGTKPFKCDQCEKCYTDKSNLKRHMLVHSGRISYKCERCGKCFTAKSSLARHLILLHSGPHA